MCFNHDQDKMSAGDNSSKNILIDLVDNIEDIQDEVSLDNLTSSDIRYIMNKHGFSREDITIELYHIFPDAFSHFEDKIRHRPDIEEFKRISERVKNHKPFNVRNAIQNRLFSLKFKLGYDIIEELILHNKYILPIKVNDEEMTSIDFAFKRPQYINSLYCDQIEDYLPGFFDGSSLNCLDKIIFYIVTKLPQIENDFYWRLTVPSNVHTFSRKLGMMIPSHTTDPIAYFFNNLPHYSNIEPGNSDYKLLPDKDIFQKNGVYYSYESRNDIIQKFERIKILTSEEVFSPLIRSILTRSFNKHNTFLENINDLYGKELIICIGNLYKFYSMTADELIHLWKANIVNMYFNHNYPFDLDRTMDKYTFKSIILLLKSFKKEEQVVELNELYGRIKLSKIDLIQNEHEMLSTFRSFPLNRQNDIEAVLLLIFELGMYFRRWKGPGHPYPIESHKTNSKEIDPNVTATPHLMLIFDKMNYDEWIGKIRVVSPNSSNYFNMNLNIESFLKKIIDGEQCIRESSTILIATAERSLKLFFGKTIPGIKSSLIDKIM